MSADTIATVISAVALLLGFVAAFGWAIRRTDAQHASLTVQVTDVERTLGARITGVERELGTRITDVQRELGARITGVERELGTRIAGVERELVEVKIAVARIEGPPRHLIPAR